ncbi:MAG: hypothetical protein WC222_03475 [Parachlamydiales bacterium]|jgi:hypothetical protein
MSYSTQLDLFKASEAVEDIKGAFKLLARQLAETQDLFNQQQQFIGSLYIDLKNDSDDYAYRMKCLEERNA